jgi:hypothetical protein
MPSRVTATTVSPGVKTISFESLLVLPSCSVFACSVSSVLFALSGSFWVLLLLLSDDRFRRRDDDEGEEQLTAVSIRGGRCSKYIFPPLSERTAATVTIDRFHKSGDRSNTLDRNMVVSGVRILVARRRNTIGVSAFPQPSPTSHIQSQFATHQKINNRSHRPKSGRIIADFLRTATRPVPTIVSVSPPRHYSFVTQSAPTSFSRWSIMRCSQNCCCCILFPAPRVTAAPSTSAAGRGDIAAAVVADNKATQAGRFLAKILGSKKSGGATKAPTERAPTGLYPPPRQGHRLYVFHGWHDVWQDSRNSGFEKTCRQRTIHWTATMQQFDWGFLVVLRVDLAGIDRSVRESREDEPRNVL